MNLREKRLEKGMTQEELGKITGFEQSRIARYEAGNREPNLEALRTLSKALDCTIDELVGNPRDNVVLSGETEKL